MKRGIAILGLIVGLIPSVGRADAQTTVEIQTFTAGASSCAGTIVAGEYENCGPALLPVTSGNSSAAQSATPDGSFSYAVSASDGNVAEGERAESLTDVHGDYTSDAPLSRVDLVMTYEVYQATKDSTYYAQGFTHGFAFAGSKSGRTASTSDSDCEDGSSIQGKGQYLGTNIDQDTPPGTYTLRLSFSCPSGANIRAQQIFYGEFSGDGIAESSNAGERAFATLGGKVDSVMFTLNAG